MNKNEVKSVNISKEWESDGWSDKGYRNGFNFVDLFAGAGGLSCGMVMAGFEPLASVEIREDAVNTYKYNFLKRCEFETEMESRDIREQEVKNNLFDKLKDKEVDVVVGGFPCQGFSIAGKRNVSDERNSLYSEMLHIVEKLQPKFVIMENVEGILSMLNGLVVEKIISDYKEKGYHVEFKLLNSVDYGVPQFRRRVIFIGNRLGIENRFPEPLLDSYVTLGESIEKYMNMSEDMKINHIFTRHSEEMKERLSAVLEGESLYPKYTESYRKSPWDKPSCTIKENHGGVCIHPKLPRVLTPRELATLQSFPEDFIFMGTKSGMLVQIGNAVPPLLGKAVGISVMKSLIE